MFYWIKKLIIGSPIPSSRALYERLSKIIALPVFGSDPISSVAYATEEILLALVLIGPYLITQSNALIYIAIAIVTLMVIVAISYRQTIFSYPSGGGAYIVAKDNLGTTPGLFAGAALMIDYVLTVAVSVSAGIAAILSFLPHYQHYHVEIAVLVIALIAIANLRGIRESGMLFASPTYIFVGSALTLIGVGLYRIITDPAFIISPPSAGSIPEPTHLGASGLLLAFLVLRAFASGCSAMTGTEAVSNGIPAFRPPESKNAAATLVIMISLLATLFLGISYIAWQGHVIPMAQTVAGYQTVPSQIAAAIFGRNWFYYLFQIATALVLILAANTSFADFPRLGSIMARDRFLPRQLYNLGDKLVYTNGIIVLSLLAIVLIIIFKGVVNALIPLYAIGVFLSFTLSQAGMVKHFIRLKERGWKRSMIISGIGATATAIVCLVQAVTKASEGAWIVLILIPAFVYLFSKIHQHYIELGNKLRLEPGDTLPEIVNTVLVLTPSIHKGVLPALVYAKGLSSNAQAIHIDTDPIDSRLLQDRWEQWGNGVPLLILESPYRSLINPLIKYIDAIMKDSPGGMVTIVIPEFVTDKWWHKLLHNQSGLLLRVALFAREGITITNMRYHIHMH
ncbi:MAG: APC family permease [Armatimonadota bacterium]